MKYLSDDRSIGSYPNSCGLKPIETIYNGYRFRSRLEARWAMCFDMVGVKYEYEPEGFVLDDNKNYLPDFYLRDFDTYIEIKHADAIQLLDIENGFEFKSKTEDAEKYVSAIRAITKDHRFAIIQGDPYDIAMKEHGGNGRGDLFFTGVCFGYIRSMFDENYICSSGQKCSECNHFLIPAHYPILGITKSGIIASFDSPPDVFPSKEGIEIVIIDGEDIELLGKNKDKGKLVEEVCTFATASQKARQARFEHGEKPEVKKHPAG